MKACSADPDIEPDLSNLVFFEAPEAAVLFNGDRSVFE